MARIGIHGGTGWLGKALGRNLLTRGFSAGALSITNRRGPTADYAEWPAVVWADGLADLADTVDVLVLSVRPEDYAVPAPSAFGGLVISFMAGIPLDRLAQDWPAARLARAMPGGGATDGRAHVPWCGNSTMTDPDAAKVVEVLSAIGTVDRVRDEDALAALTALSGSGAAYPALMAQAMYQHALSRGIAPDVAWRGVSSVICDAPELFRSGPDAAQGLIDAYYGYRGITAAGMDAAMTVGLGDAVTAALDAATEKAVTFRVDRKT